MDQICTNNGCYMFGPDTPERARCEKRCRIENTPQSAAPGMGYLSLLAALNSEDTLEQQKEACSGQQPSHTL